jgi:hypothetical protein
MQALEYVDKQIFNPSAIPCLDAKEPDPGVVPIYPSFLNDRISAQNGLFFAPENLGKGFQQNLFSALGVTENHNGFRDDGDLSGIQSSNLVKLVLKRTSIDGCRDLLKVANISAKNLFPGLEGIARSCRLFK